MIPQHTNSLHIKFTLCMELNIYKKKLNTETIHVKPIFFCNRAVRFLFYKEQIKSTLPQQIWLLESEFLITLDKLK